MFKNMKISTKILCVVLSITLGTLLFISALSYTRMLEITTYFQNVNANLGLSSSDHSKQALLDQANLYLLKLNGEQAASTDNTLKEISGSVTRLSEYMDSLYRNPENFAGRELPLPNETEQGVASSKYMLAPGVEKTPELDKELLLISNAEYAFAPVLKGNALLDNVYLGTASGISYRYSVYNSYNPDYDPRQRDWFKAASDRQGEAVWLETYVDSYGTVCITCCQSFTDAEGNFVGVVAMDITLDSMFEGITNVKIGETGYAFIFDADMNYIAHPRYGDADFPLSPLQTASGDMLTALNTIKNNDSGMVSVILDGVESYVSYATLPETGWKMCISINIDEIIAPANESKLEIDEITLEAQSSIRDKLSNIIMNYIILFTSIGILVVILAFIVSNSITRPISNLAKVAGKLGEGDLDIKAQITGNDEVGELARTFNAMTDNLKKYISELTSVTADKERIATELNVATEIQASMLPCIFPPFPDLGEFDIYAMMHPAKEVGGDFYDFYLVDDDHLAVVMADVSGKGVPAALFMVIAKTMIKNCALEGLAPKSVLEKVNVQLCESNEHGMFVTVWIGIMQISTGKMICANAGHEYPVIMRKGGKYELLHDKHGFVLAGMETAKYREYEINLDPGDKLFLYTDGVPEATNAQNELFGNDRMLDSLNRNTGVSCDELLSNIKSDIDAFVGEAPQFDDITMLTLSMNERKGERHETD